MSVMTAPLAMVDSSAGSALCSNPIIRGHSPRNLPRDLLCLHTNIRNSGYLPEPACRQRTRGEKTGPASSVRPQQMGVVVNLDPEPERVQ
ncbi:hypothetical protein D3C86_1746030 [compost metagenome]